MKFKKNLLFFTILVFLIIISSGIAFAEDENPAIPQIESGEVSGDVDIITAHPFSSKVTNDELVYEIPENVSKIKSAYAVVDTYSGSGAPDRGLTTHISLKINNKTEVLEYANLTFANNTANDPVVYQITDLTTKQYSDYQTLVDITDNVRDLSAGDTITISVNNTEWEGYTFDGRIKVIALVLAYDSDSDYKTSYWLNIGQAWTKGTLTTMFRTKDFNDNYTKVTLDSVALSSKDAIYTLNGNLLSEPNQTKDSMYIYNAWDITDNFELSKDTDFTYDGNGSSYTGSIQLLKVYSPVPFRISASITPEYSDTVYAGVNNTLKITVNCNKDFNGSVKLLIEDEEIASSDLSTSAGNTVDITLTDLTFRPIDENTINGASNAVVNYTLNILDDEGNVLNSTKLSCKVLYNGYLGKDYEYPGAKPYLREINITGEVILLASNVYSDIGDASRTDDFDVELYDGTVNTAILYVPYTEDGDINGDFNTWNATFNGQTITPIASYRDQSNLGNSGKKGWGLVVYDVSDFVVEGKNTFEFNKTAGNAAVYPSNLIILINDDKSTSKAVYILEEADLLYKSHTMNLPAGFNTTFEAIDGNANLFVFAAGAETGEGNLIINGEKYEDVWSGNDKSINIFTIKVYGTDVNVYFEATGETILGLHQMIIVEKQMPKKNLTIKATTNPITIGENATITITGLENATGNIAVTAGNSIYTPPIINGTATAIVSGLIENTTANITYKGDNKYNNASTTVKIIVKPKENATISIDDVVLYYGETVNVTATTEGSKGITAKIDDKDVSVNDYTIQISGLDAGNHTLTVSTIADANHNNVTKTVKITVNKAPAEITLTNETFDLKVKDTVGDLANLTPAYAGNLTYTSNNPNIVIVENGKIKALSKGNATITVSLTGNKNYAAENKTITVTVSLNDVRVSVENATLNLKVNDTFDIITTTSPKNLDVNYTSSNETVATVDVDGKVVAVGGGNAVITVSVGGDGVYALNSTTVNVLVKKDLKLNATTFAISGNVTLIIFGFENATGNITVTIGEDNYTSPIMMGMAFVSIPQFDKNVTAYIHYPGDGNYNNASTTLDIIHKKDLNLTVSVNLVYVGENATLIITGLENATGNVTVIAGKNIYNAPIVNSTATATISGLNNTTTAYILFLGDGNYNFGFANVTIPVLPTKENLTISASADPIYVGDEAIIVITGLENATGNVSVCAGNEIYLAPIVNGTAKAVILDLIKSVTTYVSYAGDERYNPSNTTAKITVNKIQTKLSTNAVTATYNINKYLVVTLKDANNNPVSGAKVSVKLGTTKTYKTNKKGQIKVPTKSLAPKKYTAEITFKGTEKYANSTAKVKVVVKKAPSKLAAKKKTFNDTAKNKNYYVALKDSKGKAIKNAKVTIAVKGKKYSKYTNKKGIATFNLKLSQGKYKVAVSFAGNNYYNKAKTVKYEITVKVTWKTVSRGNKDKARVIKIQRALKHNGYYIKYAGRYLMVDGIFESCTEKSVKEFQNDHRLKVTGKVDYKTAKKLKIAK